MKNNNRDLLRELHEQREQNYRTTRDQSAEQIADNTNKNGKNVALEFGVKVLENEHSNAA